LAFREVPPLLLPFLGFCTEKGGELPPLSPFLPLLPQREIFFLFLRGLSPDLLIITAPLRLPSDPTRERSLKFFFLSPTEKKKRKCSLFFWTGGKLIEKSIRTSGWGAHSLPISGRNRSFQIPFFERKEGVKGGEEVRPVKKRPERGEREDSFFSREPRTAKKRSLDFNLPQTGGRGAAPRLSSSFLKIRKEGTV